ncbi:MAG: DUF356 domain-containing protein [Theionarchaea archaeon]|nr:DUF356 domain-containing protein [Theionarchaea archaeon]MBU7038352.1 DUF356 domain-containing protein [Theionarchaea archaeon]
MKDPYILVRADNSQKAMTALADLERYANIRINEPRLMPKHMAEDLISEFLNLKSEKRVNFVVQVHMNPGEVIKRVRKIRPPAHIVVVTDRYRTYEIMEANYQEFPKIEGFVPPKPAPPGRKQGRGRSPGRPYRKKY